MSACDQTYGPTARHFLSRDPAVSLTRSPYAYVGGNPLNQSDASGLWGPFDAIVGAVTGGVGAVLTDLTSGNGVSWSDVAGGVVGGAVGGFVCPPGWFACAGAVGGFVGDLMSQGLSDGGVVDPGHAVEAGVLGGVIGSTGTAADHYWMGQLQVPIGVFSGGVAGAFDTLFGRECPPAPSPSTGGPIGPQQLPFMG